MAESTEIVSASSKPPGRPSRSASPSARTAKPPSKFKTPCSFARAERLLGRDYHGRLLIELLQNADAWQARHPSDVAVYGHGIEVLERAERRSAEVVIGRLAL
jgi:hypothetical protein